jgi:hypothetical protein
MINKRSLLMKKNLSMESDTIPISKANRIIKPRKKQRPFINEEISFYKIKTAHEKATL